MLTLPEGWPSWPSGAVVVNLMAHAPSQAVQTQIARNLMLASFELMQQRCAKRGSGPIRITPTAELDWRVGDYRFAYVPVVNDDVLFRWESDAREANPIKLIVSPRHDRLLFHALNAVLGDHAPEVGGLDAFVDLATLFSVMEFNWSRDRANIELIAAYNRCVTASQADPSIWVAVPDSCEGDQKS